MSKLGLLDELLLQRVNVSGGRRYLHAAKGRRNSGLTFGGRLHMDSWK
jgi:hypothetical protein